MPAATLPFQLSHPGQVASLKEALRAFLFCFRPVCGSREASSTLLYSMGKDADDTLMSTNITAVERKQYQSVTAKLAEYFPTGEI